MLHQSQNTPINKCEVTANNSAGLHLDSDGKPECVFGVALILWETNCTWKRTCWGLNNYWIIIMWNEELCATESTVSVYPSGCHQPGSGGRRSQMHSRAKGTGPATFVGSTEGVASWLVPELYHCCMWMVPVQSELCYDLYTNDLYACRNTNISHLLPHTNRFKELRDRGEVKVTISHDPRLAPKRTL